MKQIKLCDVLRPARAGVGGASCCRRVAVSAAARVAIPAQCGSCGVPVSVCRMHECACDAVPRYGRTRTRVCVLCVCADARLRLPEQQQFGERPRPLPDSVASSVADADTHCQAGGGAAGGSYTPTNRRGNCLNQRNATRNPADQCIGTVGALRRRTTSHSVTNEPGGGAHSNAPTRRYQVQDGIAGATAATATTTPFRRLSAHVKNCHRRRYTCHFSRHARRRLLPP